MKVAIFINNKFCFLTFSVKIGFVEEAASYNINTVKMAWEHLKIQCSESANHAVAPFLILKRERPLSYLAPYKAAFPRILLYSMQQCVYKQLFQPKRTDCLTDQSLA